MVDRLAKNDITKHDEVFKLEYTYCLTMLSYWKHEDEKRKDNDNRENNSVI